MVWGSPLLVLEPSNLMSAPLISDHRRLPISSRRAPVRDQEPDGIPKWPADKSAAAPYCHELSIGEHAVAASFAARFGKISGGIGFDDAATDCPPKESMNVGIDAARHSRGSAIGNSVDEVEHVTAPQISDCAMAPHGDHISIENPLHLIVGAILSLIPLQPLG